MGLFTQFSHDATSVERKELWNPSETLGIVNTDPGYKCITCIGYAPSQGRRCRNPIRADNREFIMSTLDELAYLPPDSPAVASRLRSIAGPALCVRWHQNQAESVVRQWQAKIKQVKPQVREKLQTKPAQTTKKQNVRPDQTIEDAQEQLREMRKILAEMQEELKRHREQDQSYTRQEKSKVENRQEEDRKRQEREQREREEREREAKKQEKEQQERKKKEEEEQQQKKEREREREQKAREQATHAERIRQKARRAREERERLDCEKAQKERAEWDATWTKYEERWAKFRSPAPRAEHLRDAIPWPVKSGCYRDVCASAVEEFMRLAVPREADSAKLMRKECRKWHPDMVDGWLRGASLTDVESIMVGMICRVVTDVLNKAAGRSAEFLG